jgi:toxin ParE1/3/4
VRVLWTPEARQDRIDIRNVIAADSLRAAARMDEIFSNAAASLSDLPMRGRAGSVVGTRELIPHDRYRLVYEVADDTVWVIALVHTSRQWPPPAG